MMNFVFFVQSLISDWNHGNAHFLRGIISELLIRGCNVTVYEPESSWSLTNLIHYQGVTAIHDFQYHFPHLKSIRYNTITTDIYAVLDNADVVIVHEWNSHDLVKQIGLYKKEHSRFLLFFHDTHHRSISDPESMRLYDLTNYDGVLAFGEVIKEIYLKNSWIQNAWVWHEAADVNVFKKHHSDIKNGDVIWIGNWGDDERNIELQDFLFNPVKTLNLPTTVYGVRYPDNALKMLNDNNIKFNGWTANYKVPEIFSRFKCTVHIPRRQYVTLLRGIPTIRPFEALACGIPLVCSFWDDAEHLFTPGEDFLVATTPNEMKKHLLLIINEPDFASHIAEHGLNTILSKHTCKHRVSQLLSICRSLRHHFSECNEMQSII